MDGQKFDSITTSNHLKFYMKIVIAVFSWPPYAGGPSSNWTWGLALPSTELHNCRPDGRTAFAFIEFKIRQEKVKAQKEKKRRDEEGVATCGPMRTGIGPA